MGNQLQHEVKKKTPFKSLKAEALLNLLRTNDQFHNQFIRLFREFGLTPSQYNILRILRGEGKPLPSLEIADRLIQVVPAITGLIDRLEKAEMVTRQRCEEDRRVVYVAITKKALKIIDKMDTPLEAMHEQLVGHMTQAELKELVRLLEKARAPLLKSTTK
ncbi:MAG: MarR family transcriptional regulator [Blastopirellula sp.]|nr:MAG: MarR family transcriptional regulator [Blastopirellula sp.]